MSDLVKIARERIDGTQATHWVGCERDHRECLIQRMADEIEHLRAALKRANDQAEHFEREWYLRGDENEKLRAALVAAMEVVKAERERITQYDFVEPKRAEELDAIIAQADVVLKYNERKEK